MKPETSSAVCTLTETAAAAVDLEALHNRIARMARFYARCASEDFEDLHQEAWLGLLEGLRELDPSIGDSAQYLLHRARWRILDTLKKGRRRRCASLEELGIEACSPISPAGLEDAEFSALLQSGQQAVLNCLMRGLTWREAGERLGCSSANIAYHVRRIRERYRQWETGGGQP